MAYLYQDWVEHGVHPIEQVPERRPWDCLKVIASLMPRDLHVGFNELDGLTDYELRARMRQLDELVRPFLAKDDDGGTFN